MKKFHTHEGEATITIEIGKAVALVLDDLLNRWTTSEDDSSLQIEHDAEWQVLSVVAGAVETQLSELFMPDYTEKVKIARQKIVERWGEVEHLRVNKKLDTGLPD